MPKKTPFWEHPAKESIISLQGSDDVGFNVLALKDRRFLFMELMDMKKVTGRDFDPRVHSRYVGTIYLIDMTDYTEERLNEAASCIGHTRRSIEELSKQGMNDPLLQSMLYKEEDRIMAEACYLFGLREKLQAWESNNSWKIQRLIYTYARNYAEYE